jgi:hypothetical protein
VSDCPRISASASRGGGEWTRGGTRGGGYGDDGGVEPRGELGALPILSFACSGGSGSGSGGSSERVRGVGRGLSIGCKRCFCARVTGACVHLLAASRPLVFGEGRRVEAACRSCCESKVVISDNGVVVAARHFNTRLSRVVLVAAYCLIRMFSISDAIAKAMHSAEYTLVREEGWWIKYIVATTVL